MIVLRGRPAVQAGFSLLLPACLLAVSCGRNPVELPIEASRAPVPAEALATPAHPSPSRAPSPEEIDQTLRRVFGSTLHPHRPAGSPGHFQGDFNGDGSEDLIVVARPAPSGDALSAINDPLAPWIIRDALQPTAPHVRASHQALAVRPDEVLLAVVHGYQASGWRNPESRHGYLLKNAMGDRMLARPSAEVIVVAQTGARAVGHVLTGTIDGRSGYLYWTGGRYLWRRI